MGLILASYTSCTSITGPGTSQCPSLPLHIWGSEPNHIDQEWVTKLDKSCSNGIRADFSTWQSTTTHHLSCHEKLFDLPEGILNHRIFWVRRDPQGPLRPTLQWIPHTGIKPLALVLSAHEPISTHWRPSWVKYFLFLALTAASAKSSSLKCAWGRADCVKCFHLWN